jgi:hypothetical protein
MEDEILKVQPSEINDVVAHLNHLAPYHVTTRDMRLEGRSSRSRWEVITTKTELQGEKERLITDVMSMTVLLE